MLATTARTPIMGPLASPTASSPGSDHMDHHHMNHLDDDHPADLSPRSTNSSSLDSSNESLHNTRLSLTSPSAGQIRNKRRASGASNPEETSAAIEKDNSSTATLKIGDEVNPLQNLRNAFERSPCPVYYNGDSPGSDNEQLQRHINKAFSILGSPVAETHHHLLNSPTNLSTKSGDESDEEGQRMVMDLVGHVSPGAQINPTTIAAVIFQCPLCAVVCNSRHDFNEHLVTHSTEHRACPKCNYVATNDDDLRDHVAESHGPDDLEMLSDDDELKTPKTNAQGKLKTFKCKQCEYTAVTKKEFWDHNKTHIRSEKMLHCPKCAFVTEYKHHLEYHLRNHMGSKPYQCTKCNYSCVNKSMLNSHLKSHSNIYQYRCSDCSYATKYCHSLKLHLRKYNHNPAMVLNPDGTPNPLPIIDVYGTRRGPKIKRPDPLLEGLATTQPLSAMPPTPTKAARKRPASQKSKTEKAQQKLLHQHILDARDLSPKPATSPRYTSSMPNQSTTPPLKKIKEDPSSGDSDSDVRMSFLSGRATQLPQAPISPSSIALILQRSNGNNTSELRTDTAPYARPQGSPNHMTVYQSALNQFMLNPMFRMQNSASLPELLAAQQLANEQKTKLLAHLLQSAQSGTLPTPLSPPQNGPTDLAKSSAPSQPTFNNSGMALDLSGGSGSTNFVATDDTKKRKRKGKAHRYERRCTDEDNEQEELMRSYPMEEEALDFSNNNSSDYKDNNRKRSAMSAKLDRPTDLSVSYSPPPQQNLMCRYCAIAFPVEELYIIHMNYHSGENDPFLCRPCGKRTRNSVEFFKHIASDPH